MCEARYLYRLKYKVYSTLTERKSSSSCHVLHSRAVGSLVVSTLPTYFGAGGSNVFPSAQNLCLSSAAFRKSIVLYTLWLWFEPLRINGTTAPQVLGKIGFRMLPPTGSHTYLRGDTMMSMASLVYISEAPKDLEKRRTHSRSRYDLLLVRAMVLRVLSNSFHRSSRRRS